MWWHAPSGPGARCGRLTAATPKPLAPHQCGELCPTGGAQLAALSSTGRGTSWLAPAFPGCAPEGDGWALTGGQWWRGRATAARTGDARGAGTWRDWRRGAGTSGGEIPAESVGAGRGADSYLRRRTRRRRKEGTRHGLTDEGLRGRGQRARRGDSQRAAVAARAPPDADVAWRGHDAGGHGGLGHRDPVPPPLADVVRGGSSLPAPGGTVGALPRIGRQHRRRPGSHCRAPPVPSRSADCQPADCQPADCTSQPTTGQPGTGRERASSGTTSWGTTSWGTTGWSSTGRSSLWRAGTASAQRRPSSQPPDCPAGIPRRPR